MHIANTNKYIISINNKCITINNCTIQMNSFYIYFSFDVGMLVNVFNIILSFTEIYFLVEYSIQ
jgi:hypothetical protein